MKTNPRNTDILLNRILYSLVCVRNLIRNCAVKGMYRIFDLTIGRLIYSIPCVRRRVKRTIGADTYEEYIEKTATILKKAKVFSDERPGYAIEYCFLILFSLPWYLMFNVVTLYSKRAWLFMYNGNDFVRFIIIAVPVVISFILCELIFFRNDRYLKFFATFKKEKPPKVVIWATGIGTLMFIILLFIANLAIMEYADTIYNIHHH